MVLHLGLAVSVLTLAGFVQGLTGFGFGLIAMALLPSIVDYHLAALLVVLFTFPVSAINFYDNRKHFQWRNCLTLVLGMCCGVPCGVYLMVHTPRDLLLRMLGTMLVLFAVNELVLSRYKLHVPQWLGFPLGFCSGVLGGAFNAGGPTSVAYCYSRPWSKEQIVAVLQVIFIGSAISRLVLFNSHGIAPAGVVGVVSWSALPVLAALLLGMHWFRSVRPDQLRFGIYLFLGVMGVKYIVWP